jgi:hypothetical protein
MVYLLMSMAGKKSLYKECRTAAVNVSIATEEQSKECGEQLGHNRQKSLRVWRQQHM